VTVVTPGVLPSCNSRYSPALAPLHPAVSATMFPPRNEWEEQMKKLFGILGLAAISIVATAAPTLADALPYGPDTCKSGYVWREASPSDHVCVTPASRTRAQNDNAQAFVRRSPIGGAYGPDTCLPGFVWREAFPGDRVCVTPQTRTETAEENRLGMSRRVLAYGPDTCKDGYVWREARPADHVCVTPEARSRTASENAAAASRVQPGGGAYGPATCIAGFVWREAYPGDVVCVTPEIRELVKQENILGPSRRVAP
jgi:hypothetical protein